MKSNMQPYLFKPVYVERIWGGRGFEKYRTDMPAEGVIGESWDISAHPNGMSVVASGDEAGMSLEALIEKYQEKFVGTKVKGDFPLLVKLIDSNDSLSVQVHPGDEYAKRVENELGKTECWYVVDAKENAELVIGTQSTDKEVFKQAALEGTLDQHLNSIPVKKGDFFYIPSGLIHAIGPGVVIAEIQQSSDVTYRVYDYNRGREMHLEKAMEVADLTLKPQTALSETVLCEGEYFTVEKHVIEDEWIDRSNEEKFYIYTCVDGEGTLSSFQNTYDLKVGDSVFIPATAGVLSVSGTLTLLKSYITTDETK